MFSLQLNNVFQKQCPCSYRTWLLGTNIWFRHGNPARPISCPSLRSFNLGPEIITLSLIVRLKMWPWEVSSAFSPAMWRKLVWQLEANVLRAAEFRVGHRERASVSSSPWGLVDHYPCHTLYQEYVLLLAHQLSWLLVNGNLVKCDCLMYLKELLRWSVYIAVTQQMLAYYSYI